MPAEASARTDGRADPATVSAEGGRAGPDGRLRVLVVLGHPRGADSLCGTIADAFAEGAREAGCRVRQVDLSSLTFERDLVAAVPAEQPLEPDLKALRAAIESSDHLVFVYPTWWGTCPALLKSCLDRLLLPEWAFSTVECGTGHAGLLAPRTAELVTTMDTPAPVYALLYRSPGRNALARATLGFCGIEVVRHTRFGPVESSTAPRRAFWLGRARLLGARLGEGPRGPLGRVGHRVTPWLAALRLQFYPMAFLAYWLGASIAAARAGEFDAGRFWLGYLVLFAIEAASVFANEIGDATTDRANVRWGPFNGGSRVLPDGRLSEQALRRGTWVALGTAAVAAMLLIRDASAPGVLAPFLAVFAVLAVGYTAAPLRLSYRTLGEIDVALTHGLLAVLAGHLVQDGAITDAGPWALGIALAISIVPAITLSAVPDHEADLQAGKRTLVVRLGIPTAVRLAGYSAPAAVIAMIAVEAALPGRPFGPIVPILAGLHAALIMGACVRHAGRPPRPRRLDPLVAASLLFILWFCVPPLLRTGAF